VNCVVYGAYNYTLPPGKKSPRAGVAAGSSGEASRTATMYRE